MLRQLGLPDWALKRYSSFLPAVIYRTWVVLCTHGSLMRTSCMSWHKHIDHTSTTRSLALPSETQTKQS